MDVYETHINQRETKLDWCNFCRDECERYLKLHPSEVAGMDDNWEPIVEHSDETSRQVRAEVVSYL